MRFRLAPQLIPISLDIFQTIQNHEAVFTEEKFRPGVRDATGLFFGARVIMHGSWVGCIVRWDDVDLASWFGGGDAGMDGFERGGELLGAVGEDYELIGLG